MNINMAPYLTPKQSGLNAGIGMIKMPTTDSDEKVTESQTSGVATHSEHLIPYLMRFVLENRMGVLPYQSQLNERKLVAPDGSVSFQEIRRYNVREKVQEIDDHKIKLAQGSAKKSERPRKREDEAVEVERFKLQDQLERLDSDDSVNIHGEEDSDKSEENVEDNLDHPSLYFGDAAKDKFWDFYKSERKFKDFNATK